MLRVAWVGLAGDFGNCQWNMPYAQRAGTALSARTAVVRNQRDADATACCCALQQSSISDRNKISLN